MVQVPILSGIYADNGPDLRVALPVNMCPVATENGVSGGYMRPAPGIVLAAIGAGRCRGLFNWNGVLYGVFGTRFISIDASHDITTLGTIADGGPVTMVNSFERLAIASGGHLYYWDGSTLTTVTDPDLGTCLDVEWVGGYFVSTDGESLVTTSLLDPTVVRPFDYANPESSPDPVVAVLRTRNEINALGRITIEVFANVGGDGFPLAPIQGAQVQKGVVGTHACCKFVETIAFLGSGDNEGISVYLVNGGAAQKISTVEVDRIIASFTETQLADVVLEAREDAAHQYLYVHLPDRTLVFDALVSQQFGKPAWHVLTSTLSGYEQYRARYFTRCYDRWYCGDTASNSLGYLDETIGSQFGSDVRCEFSTQMLYGESKPARISVMELVALPGHVPVSATPTLSTSYSLDGQTWSLPQTIDAGLIGDRRKRLQWRRQGWWANFRIQRFTFTTEAHLSVLRLEATIIPSDRR